MKLAGIIPPVPTSYEGTKLKPESISQNIEKLGCHDIGGYLMLGSNGEAILLNEKEKRTIVETARKTVQPGKILMVGAGEESTDKTIELVNQCADGGADCALVLTPFFYKSAMNDNVLVRHFMHVADKARIPILLYNVPQFTGVSLTVGAVSATAAHPNIVGMKDSSGDIKRMAEYISATPNNFKVFSGNANTFLASLAIGAAGGILAVANVLPDACVRLYELWNSGEINEARELQFRLNPLATAVTSTYGIAGLKAAMDLCGLYGGPVRRPLLSVSDEERSNIQRLLEEFRAGG